jgi:hypothetical protein
VTHFVHTHRTRTRTRTRTRATAHVADSDVALIVSIPKYFTEDYFAYLEEPERPSFRWILVGPTRSGTHAPPHTHDMKTQHDTRHVPRV